MKLSRMLDTAKAGVLAIAATALAQPALADVKVGFSGVMSGPVGILGQEQYDGFMLGVELLQGKLGGQTATVLKEDDQVRPEVGAQITRKYLEKDKVDVLVGLGFTNVLMASLPLIAESGVPALATNAGPSAVAGASCKPNLFTLAWQSDGPAEGMGSYMTSKGVKKVVLLAPNYQAGRDMLNGFKRFFKGAVVDEIYTQINQPDYSAEIAQVQAANPDAVFFFYSGGMGVNFIKQMNQAGLGGGKLPLYSVFTVDATTLPALKDQAVGVYSSALWDAGLDNPASKQFVAAFEKKYRRTPSLYAATGFDAANLLDAAIKQAGGKANDKAALAAAIKSAAKTFPTVRGSFAFNNNNMPIQNFYVFQAAKSGDGVQMKQVATALSAHKDSYAKDCKLPS
ncbi:amino acid/amide ABC transporter substrate-binding protein, HAAT family [Variovorax sp. YR216]|nr:amino acid/amide ABC transporter substrate-binding protein, HAAT family [Variovorax sp. YR216]